MVIDIVCPAVGNPVSTHVGEVIVDVYPMHYNWKNQITTICDIGVVGCLKLIPLWLCMLVHMFFEFGLTTRTSGNIMFPDGGCDVIL